MLRDEDKNKHDAYRRDISKNNRHKTSENINVTITPNNKYIQSCFETA